MRLAGKTAIITGGAGSAGAEIVRTFAREGADVVIVDLFAADGEALAAELNADGKSATYVNMDITSATEWEALAKATVARTGRIDVLVNNAAISSMIAPDIFDLDVWQRMLSVNLTGPFLGIKAVLPAMQAGGSGSIVNICSIGALIAADPGHVGYSASKAGLAGLTRTIADRYGPDGVRANNIYPGALPPMRKPEGATTIAATEGARERMVQMTPVRRLGRPDDIANAALYFASDESGYVTGADLVVDGGIVIK